MNLTLTQAFHRTQTLGGLIKAGESALADCADDAAAKQRIADIAVEGVHKAKATLAALYAERDELADHMAALVRQTGDAPQVLSEAEDLQTPREPNSDAPEYAWQYGKSVAETTACNTGIQAEPFADFGHPTQNGLDAGVNEALDRARSV